LERALQEILAKVNLAATMSRDLDGLATPVSITTPGISAAAALLRVLRDTQLQLLVAPNGRTVLVARPPEARFGIVKGKVTDANSGEALSRVHEQVGSSGRLSALTDASGHFMVRHVPAGMHVVAVDLLGYARVVVES